MSIPAVILLVSHAQVVSQLEQDAPLVDCWAGQQKAEILRCVPKAMRGLTALDQFSSWKLDPRARLLVRGCAQRPSLCLARVMAQVVATMDV